MGRRPPAGLVHERGLALRGFERIAGVDEVGRGSLAGPVVAAAVVLDPRRRLAGLRDSKLLSPGERFRLARIVAQGACACALGVVEAEEIDRTDILRATLAAMRQAVEALSIAPDFVLVDALTIPGIEVPQRGLVRGDRISASVAAASIVAKVYRDQMMRALHGVYPAYGFAENKGYGTRAHLEALRRHGSSPLHRKTFRGVPLQAIAPAGAAPRSL